MTSKEEYKGHVRALLSIWIEKLEHFESLGDESTKDPEVEKVITAMKLEKEGKEVPVELLK